ncbi:MAG: hypothetical protein QGI08_09320 [Paracoccaceae bacterium]|nr:hypothetical protein [Paracoccaceae bacterium]MDP7185905.1 hypothetical protein [Paracoccaceae bacterium]
MRTILSLAFAVLASAASAHAPVINDGLSNTTADSPYEISKPEHSKAIYSELTGAPQYYRISSDVPFRFYAGLTAPKLEGCALQQTFDLDVLDSTMARIDRRAGDDVDWWEWYEEFGKTWYWVGPEIGADFKGDRTYPAGTYYLKVSNKTNSGKYVLAVGDEEQFGIGTIAGMLMNGTMKKIRTGWWDENSCNGSKTSALAN